MTVTLERSGSLVVAVPTEEWPSVLTQSDVAEAITAIRDEVLSTPPSPPSPPKFASTHRLGQHRHAKPSSVNNQLTLSATGGVTMSGTSQRTATTEARPQQSRRDGRWTRSKTSLTNG